MSNPKSVLDTYEVNPKKSLGQNFMHDPNALDKIVAEKPKEPGKAFRDFVDGLLAQVGK